MIKYAAVFLIFLPAVMNALEEPSAEINYLLEQIDGIEVEEGGVYIGDEDVYLPPPKSFTKEEMAQSVPLALSVSLTEQDDIYVLPPPKSFNVNKKGKKSKQANIEASPNPVCQQLQCQICQLAGCTGGSNTGPTLLPPPPTPSLAQAPPPAPFSPTATRPDPSDSTTIPPEKIGSCPDAQEALDAHNAARKEWGASPLLWSRTLANYAQSVSDTCVFRHSSGPYGENLAIGTSLDCTRAVDLWVQEQSSYSSGSGFSSSTGHFTAVVWKETRQVGCAITNCSGRNFVTCSYYPAGNVIGQFQQNVGPRV